MNMDQESQDDELLALASIYNDEDTFSITQGGTTGETNSRPGGRFSAHLSLPYHFVVTFPNAQSGM